MSALKVAKAWGKRPLEVVAGRRGAWSEEDTLLAMALDAYLATRVNQLGLPKRDTADGDPEGHFEVRTTFDASVQALEMWKKSDEAKNLAPGMVPFVVDTRREVLPADVYVE